VGLADLARSTFDRRTRLDPDRLRKARPLRNPIVETEVQEDGIVILAAPLEQVARGLVRLLARRSAKPSVKRYELEPVGALVWSLCDGKTSFERISKQLRDTYRMNRLEADASLIAFLQMLAERRLVTLYVEQVR
jgi:hypothetical protein